MTSRTKARPKTEQLVRVFVDSNGRTCPKGSCLDTGSCRSVNQSTPRLDRASLTTHPRRRSLDLLHPLPMLTTTQHIDEYALDARILGIRSTIMKLQSPRDEHANPLVESSKMAEQRLKRERQSAGTSRRTSIITTEGSTSSATSIKRADSKISNTSKPSSLTATDNNSSLKATVPANDDKASMHSDQSFDLGYKSRPAPPYINKSNMRVWNSMYTRPLEDMLREILEVRYPLYAEDDVDERNPLLGLGLGLATSHYGWLCGLRTMWRTSVHRGEDEQV